MILSIIDLQSFCITSFHVLYLGQAVLRSKKDFRRVYRYIPSQKWNSESILNTSWGDKNLKNNNHSEGADNFGFTY